MDLVIFAHPDNKKSHNASVLRYVKERLKANGVDYEVVDLYAERFDPLIRLVDFDMPAGTGFEEVKDYQALVRKAERLVFIYPVWWYNMPAILKGFFDRVFTGGFAYNFSMGKDGAPKVKPLLKGKRAVVINTFGHGEEAFRKYGMATTEVIDKDILGFSGMKCKRVNWFSVKGAPILPGSIAKRIDAALA
jgi:NAD(P)H dehydrogenase (quinone)